MSAYVITNGIVLRVRPWREHDRLYTLFTAAEGKADVIVAGGSKISSKLAPHLQPFASIEFMLARGKQLDRLAAAKVQHVYLRPPYTLAQAGICSSTLELVRQLTREGQVEPDMLPALYHTWEEFGSLLWSGEGWREPARSVLGRFTARLLTQVGLHVPLTRCEMCSQELTAPATFCWERHAFFHRSHAPAGAKQVAVEPETLTWLAKGHPQADRMPASALAFLTDFVQGQIGYSLTTLQVVRSMF